MKKQENGSQLHISAHIVTKNLMSLIYILITEQTKCARKKIEADQSIK
jgi:hypothetical protein